MLDLETAIVLVLSGLLFELHVHAERGRRVQLSILVGLFALLLVWCLLSRRGGG